MKPKKSIVIGLTGGPGTGKSLAAEFMRDKGAIVLSGDEAGRRTVEIRSILRRLVKTFGKGMLDKNGKLDRKKLGRIVFSDFDKLEKLNEIVHPRLLRILKADIFKHKRKGIPLIVVDAALIFEWGIANWVNFIVVVTARREIRIARMMKSGLTRKEASDRINSQIPDSEKAALADYVIENSGTKAGLRRKVQEFLQVLPMDKR
jgi:dephospho-CoA kinase